MTTIKAGKWQVNGTITARIWKYAAMLLMLLTLGVGQMWATKKVWIDVENAPSGYTDKMQVQYYSGSSYTNVWASEYGSVNGRSIWSADIPDGATKWEVHRGDALNGSYYNWQGEQTYSDVNYYKVTGWDGGGTVNNVIGMVRGGYIYFDNSITGWTGKIQFVVGHSSYSRTYEMTQLTGTKIWYVNLTGKDNHEWNDAQYYAFIASTNKVADGSWGSSSLSSKATKYTAAYTSKYNLDNGSTYWCVPSGSSNGSSFSIDYKSGYSNIPTNTMTVTVRTKETGGSYGSSYNSPTTVTVQTRYLSNNGTSSTQSASVSTSAKSNTKADVTTGEVNFSYTALDDDAQWAFDGWGTTNSATSSTNSNYRIDAGSSASKTATTIYAFFTRKPLLTVNCGSNGTSASGSATNNAKTAYNISATPASGYQFKEWTVSSGSVTFGSSTSASTTATISADATITATFEEKNGGMITLNAGTGGEVSTDNSTWGSTKYITDITTATDKNIYARASTGYAFNTWTKSSGSGTIKTNAASGVFTTVAFEDATVTASFNETMSSLSTSCSYNAGNPSYSAPTVGGSATTVGYVTTRTITATAAGTGYTFAGWTLTNCTRTDGGSATTNPITIRSNGDGEDVSVVANYTEVLTTNWKLIGDNQSGGPFGDNYTYASGKAMSKKTGHSTESNAYVTVNVTKIPADNYGFKVATSNSDDNKWGYGTSDGYYIDFNRSASNTQKQVYSGSQHQLRFYPDGLGEYEFKVDYTTNKYVYVTFPTNVDVVTFGKGTGGNTVTAKYSNVSFTSGTKVQRGKTVRFTQTANTGYTFSKWYTTSTGTGGTQLSTSATYDHTVGATNNVYAIYTINNHNITRTSPTNGTYTIKVGSAAAVSTSTTSDYGKTITLAATPNTGYYLSGWTVTKTGDASTVVTVTNNTFTMPDYDVTVTATFANQWGLYSSINSWGTPTALGNYSTSDGKNYGYVEVSLAANTQYSFKIRDFQTGNNYKPSSNTEITYANKATAQTMSSTVSGEPNQTIKTAAAGTYRFTWNITDKKIAVTYPVSYKVTFGKGTGGLTITATSSTTGSISSGNYVGSGENVTFTETHTTPGYTFTGWYTASTGGSAVAKMGVSDNVLESIAADANVYSRYTPNNYTVTFDATTNSGSCATESKSVTYGSAYGELPTATHAANTFIGWYTTASGEGTRVTAETIVSTASDHTLHARFESTYEVSVQFKCGDDVLYPQTKVYASPTSLAADISAPEILGYSFAGWEVVSGTASIANTSSATTTVNASTLAVIKATYSAVPIVYFKNNLGWKNVYVSFDIDFVTAAGATVPKNNGKPYYKMTQLGSSDIFYCEIPSTYTASDYASWAWNIAFDNKGFGDYSSTHTGNSNSFYQNEFLGRADFDPKATMYIPYKGDKETRNSGTYYPTGCWMKYNSTESGYKVKVNTWVNNAHEDTLSVDLKAVMAGEFEFSAKVDLKRPNYTYGFKLYKDYQKNTNDLYYSNSGEIRANTTTLPWAFYTRVDDAAVTADSKRCGVHTEALGEYEFTVSFATGKPMVNVTYPVGVGDYRLVYKDRATWSNAAHTAAWAHPSRVIKAKANAEDIISFYVAYGSTPTVELQKCTAINAETGAQTWTKQGSDLDLSSITKKGIYNFKVTQNSSKVATAAYDGVYSGDFYIRTDASDGGWENYKSSANTMTYSEYADENGDYTHYFMAYRGSGTNVKFVIANDYSPCISDTLEGDTYTGNSQWLPANANIRFMWDNTTNKISRAYLSGSSVASERFLVLEGDSKMFNSAGTPLTTGNGRVEGLNQYEMNFTDKQNWVYEATVQAQPGGKVKLTAKYNNKIQYFYGGAGTSSADSVSLIGGSGTTKYTVNIVYDFKTNRLIKAFMPGGAISDNLSIEADLMLIREAQEDAQQITFNGGSLTNVKTVYGAMKFNKWTVNDKQKTGEHANAGLTRYARDIFYISFPFDVKLNEVIGFGTYGTHWIIEYYDGKGRAEKGFWADSDSFWKFVTPSEKKDFKLNAYEGYILALDLDEMTESSAIWDHGVEDVYVYFPSNGNVGNISSTYRLIGIDQEGYECTIGPRFTGGDDRTKKDSYWHVIGVPSYANYSSALKPTSDGATIDWHDDDGVIDWSTPSLPYLYEWNSSDNSLAVTSSATFSFKAMYSYMVQYAGSSIYWSAVNATTPTGVVARRQNAPTNTEFRLELQHNEEKADQAFIRMTDDENVTTGFDFNYDLSKEFNKNRANIYTLIPTETNGIASVTQVAGNVLPMSEQTTIVPVGVKIAANDDYTFSIPDGTEGVGVTLIDTERGIRTNLSALDYTVSLEAGTYDSRFVLEISAVASTPTVVEAVTGDGLPVTGARKVMIDGLLYIVRDGKMFDARGARVE